ncbi:MAG: glycosyltransferase family 9 protein [Cyanobacteria bacterium HKST-UBA02]|nr:glycosyltransferase family 9 protein [Cyanobacteria bacterium HKST-UBA02]
MELLKNNPAVDEIVVFPKGAWLSEIANPAKWWSVAAQTGRFAADLRERRFDMSVDFQGLLKSAIPGYMSGARLRVGFAGTRECSSALYSHRLDVGDYFADAVHVVEHNLALARFAVDVFGGTAGGADVESGAAASDAFAEAKFPLPLPGEDTVTRVDALLAGTGSELAVLIPGTTWASKIWPRERFVELSLMLEKKYGLTSLLVGGPSEKEANEQIVRALRESNPQFPVLDLTGRTSLTELIEIYRRSKVVVGLDTGPLHLAAATEIPLVVGVFGSTPWRRNGPFGSRAHSVSLALDCQPCFEKTCPLGTLACLEELSAGRVMERVEALL